MILVKWYVNTLMGELDRYVFYIGSQIFSLNILEQAQDKLRKSQNISGHLRKAQNKPGTSYDI